VTRVWIHDDKSLDSESSRKYPFRIFVYTRIVTLFFKININSDIILVIIIVIYNNNYLNC